MDQVNSFQEIHHMKKYIKCIILTTYVLTKSFLYTQENENSLTKNDDIMDIYQIPMPIQAPQLISLTIKEDGIHFYYNEDEDATGRYWPKTNTSNGFAYINDLLYNDVIESPHQLTDTALEYLGYVIPKETDTIYLYGTCEQQSDIDTKDTQDQTDEQSDE